VQARRQYLAPRHKYLVPKRAHLVCHLCALRDFLTRKKKGFFFRVVVYLVLHNQTKTHQNKEAPVFQTLGANSFLTCEEDEIT